MITAVMLVACAETPKEEVVGEVEVLYNKGMAQIEQNKLTDAIHTFEELERQHPYSGWATRAKVMSTFANFKQGNLDEVIAASETFARLHPGHKDLPYMLYLRGMAFYSRISDVARDQGFTREALAAFEEIVNRFPDSQYAQDAKLKITLCHDHLAGQEMMVARYYQQQKQYLAAANRFRTVVKNYEKTAQTPEALYRLVEINLALGLTDEASKNAAVLGYNYPQSQWYADAYALLVSRNMAPAGEQGTWAGKIWKGLEEAF